MCLFELQFGQDVRPGVGDGASYRSSVFSLLRGLHMAFHGGCTDFRSASSIGELRDGSISIRLCMAGQTESQPREESWGELAVY